MFDKVSNFEKEFERLTDPLQKLEATRDFCYSYLDSMEYTDYCYQKIQESSEILKKI